MTKLMWDGLLEQHVREEFRNRWTGWLETYEPGRGGGIGVPDTQIMVGQGKLVPIELKRGLVIGERLFPDDVRPGQVGWHTRFADAGGQSYFLIGTKEDMFLVTAMPMISFRSVGIPLGIASCHRLPIDLTRKHHDHKLSTAIIKIVS